MILVRLLLCVCLSLPNILMAGAPIAVEVNVPQTTLTVGEPLVIELRATNITEEPLKPFGVFSSEFSLTFYQEDIVEDCFVLIASIDPIEPPPPRPPLFSFRWQLKDDLQPGDTVYCQITYTQTLYPGEETITLSSVIEGSLWPDLAEFTYMLQGQPPQPARPVPTRSPFALSILSFVLLSLGGRHLRISRIPKPS